MTRTERDARNERIRALLRAGSAKVGIATELGISLSVVSAVALRAGFRTRPGPPRRYAWEAIAAYYDEGRTKRECREKFGFSPGAWDQAVIRGDIKPRERPDPIRHSHATRNRVAELLDAGVTQAQIARELGISKGTVAFHVRRLGIPPDRRFARRYDWTEIQRAYDGGLSRNECREMFGVSAASWTQAVARGDLIPRPRREALNNVLVLGRRRNRYHLKRRLLEAGLKSNRCEECGLTEWRGQRIPLELHHRYGDPLDNRLESLELLCPNCHSQTETYGRRNAVKRSR